MQNNDLDENKKFLLYQKTVQNVKKETDFFKKLYKNTFNKIPTKLREDFCGTGLICCQWVKDSALNTAVGLDINEETIAWGLENNVKNLTSGSQRIELIKH